MCVCICIYYTIEIKKNTMKLNIHSKKKMEQTKRDKRKTF